MGLLASFSEFRWHVFSGGYHCEDCKSSDGKTQRIVVPRWLKTKGPLSLNERFPMEEEPALHRHFANVALNEEAILAFANEWGPLQNAHESELQDSGDEDVEFTAWVSDSVEYWLSHIKKMNALIELWDVLGGGSRKRLTNIIDISHSGDESLWDVEIVFKASPELRRHFQFSERDWPGFADLLEIGGKRELARMCLIELVNDSLWGSCSPWLNLRESSKEVELCFTPHNLGAALWLMFAQEILGQKTLKKCQFCKRYFEVPKVDQLRRQRSDKKYCSPRCRAAAFKERHLEK